MKHKSYWSTASYNSTVSFIFDANKTDISEEESFVTSKISKGKYNIQNFKNLDFRKKPILRQNTARIYQKIKR